MYHYCNNPAARSPPNILEGSRKGCSHILAVEIEIFNFELEAFQVDLEVVGNHESEDRGDPAVGDEDDGEGGHQGDGDRPLGVPRLLSARRDRVESDKSVETCRGS